MKEIEKSFYRRWMSKVENCKSIDWDDDLTVYFDKFFSLYVVYNFLYNRIPETFNNRWDRTKATECVKNYLKSRKIDQIMLTHENALNDLKMILESKRFAICSQRSGSEHNEFNTDEKLLNGLNGKSKDKKAKALLCLIYNVRCNMFHGDKGFERVQAELLRPALILLEALVRALFCKMQKETT